MLRVKGEIDINQAAHWAMNLGCEKLADSLYRTMLHCEGQRSIRVNGLRFRRERIEATTNNSYQAVLGLTNKERISIIEKAIHSCIEFNGGIGDHLEELSRIIPWMQSNNIEITFSSSESRIKQLQSATSEYRWRKKVGLGVTSKYFLAALGEQLPKPKSFINDINTQEVGTGDVLLCLTAAGDSDKLSRWARSLRLNDTRELIKRINSYCGKITDISVWKEWELTYLNQVNIARYDPTKGDIMDLAKLVADHKFVITIDTAMAHLCAAANKKCIVMLPRYYDERWNELMQENTSYRKNCTLVIQEKHGIWDESIEKVANIIKNLSCG